MKRRLLAALAAANLMPAVAVPFPAAAVAAPAAPGGCAVTYQLTTQWPGHFQAAVAVTNRSGVNWTSWRLRYDYIAGQRVLRASGARVIQVGPTVTADNERYNGTVPDGGTAHFTILGSF